MRNKFHSHEENIVRGQINSFDRKNYHLRYVHVVIVDASLFLQLDFRHYFRDYRQDLVKLSNVDSSEIKRKFTTSGSCYYFAILFINVRKEKSLNKTGRRFFSSFRSVIITRLNKCPGYVWLLYMYIIIHVTKRYWIIETEGKYFS